MPTNTLRHTVSRRPSCVGLPKSRAIAIQRRRLRGAARAVKVRVKGHQLDPVLHLVEPPDD
eukprot:9673739-Lingulodinium_polyedra.AAC.1